MGSIYDRGDMRWDELPDKTASAHPISAHPMGIPSHGIRWDELMLS